MTNTILLNGQPFDIANFGVVAEDSFDYEPQPFCQACGRCTDHVGEHDPLVDWGFAVNGGPGELWLTDLGRYAKSFPGLWSWVKAAEFAQYDAWMAER